MKTKIYYISILLAVILVSCSSPTIETFFIEKGVTQYFISPAEFSSDNLETSMDFTLRTSEKYSNVTCNFTIFYEDTNLGNLEEAKFIINNAGEKLELDSLSLLFRDIMENKVRYTSYITKDSFKKLFTSDEVVFEVNTGSKSYKQEASSGFYSLKEEVGNKLVPHLE